MTICNAEIGLNRCSNRTRYTGVLRQLDHAPLPEMNYAEYRCPDGHSVYHATRYINGPQRGELITHG